MLLFLYRLWDISRPQSPLLDTITHHREFTYGLSFNALRSGQVSCALHPLCVSAIQNRSYVHDKYSDTCERRGKDIQIKSQGNNLSKKHCCLRWDLKPTTFSILYRLKPYQLSCIYIYIYIPKQLSWLSSNLLYKSTQGKARHVM